MHPTGSYQNLIGTENHRKYNSDAPTSEQDRLLHINRATMIDIIEHTRYATELDGGKQKLLCKLISHRYCSGYAEVVGCERLMQVPQVVFGPAIQPPTSDVISCPVLRS